MSIKRRIRLLERHLGSPDDPAAKEQAERAERFGKALVHDERLLAMYHELLMWISKQDHSDEDGDEVLARWPGWPAMLERFEEWDRLEQTATRESCGMSDVRQ